MCFKHSQALLSHLLFVAIFCFVCLGFVADARASGGMFGGDIQNIGNYLGIDADANHDVYGLGGRFGYQFGDYQFSSAYNAMTLTYDEWPKNLVQTSATVSRSFLFDDEKMLIFSLGMGVSSELNSDAFTHPKPNIQFMYMSPPAAEKHWGYGAGLMMMPSSPIGFFPIPMLMAIYSHGESFRMMLGFPFVALSLVGEHKFDLMIAPEGVQRASIKRDFSNKLSVAFAYKQERSLFDHISNWDSNQLLSQVIEKTGLEIEYQWSNSMLVALEGGYLYGRQIQRIESGFSLNPTVLFERKYGGGAYFQCALTRSF